MITVRVEYHREGDDWWADSTDVPGWTAGGGSLAEAREQVLEGLPFFLEVSEIEILETYAEQPVVVYSVKPSAHAAPFLMPTPSTAPPTQETTVRTFTGGPAHVRVPA